MARMRTTLVAATATIAALAAPTTASAVTCSGLQPALNAAPAFGTVTLDEGQSCNDHFDLPSRSVTLQGGGSGATLTGLSKGNFQILAGHNTASTTIRNLTFLEGSSQDNGGAIRLTGDNAVTIEDNTFLGNHADDNGGAISIDSQDQGPILTRGDAVPNFLRGNTFGGTGEGDENTADENGGAVYVNDPFRGVVIDEGNLFLGNRANSGGGLYINQTPELTLLDNRFEGNRTFGGEGGGAAVNLCFGGEISDNDFVGNEISTEGGSVEGGGLAVYRNGCFEDRGSKARGSDTIELTQSGNLFQDNAIDGASSAVGGGEYIEDFRTLSTNDSFVSNEIDTFRQGFGGGLGIFGFASNPLTARNLVATGNEIDIASQQVPERGLAEVGLGGGIFAIGNEGSVFRIEDSTIEGNSAAQGPGIASQALQVAGRGEAPQADLVLQNSIVINGGSEDDDIFGFDRDITSSDVCVKGLPPIGEGNICADPKLTAPDSDGNVDQTSTSPTIDAGDNTLVDGDLTGDYKTDARVLNGKVDMGADEYKPAAVKPPPPVVTQPTPPAPAAGGVQGVQQRSCASKRVFKIRIRVPKGKKALSAVVRVNNKKVRVVRGKRLKAAVRLRGLPKGRFTVKITVRLANGKKITGKRVYHTCIPRLPGDGPPKV